MKDNLRIMPGVGVLPFFFLTFFSASALAEPDYSSCGYNASSLASIAFDVESAKSSYESACNPYYGYLKNDEAACSAWGYERSRYKDAISNFENARSSVELSCEADAAHLRMLRQLSIENKRLKDEIEKLKAHK